MDTRDSSIFQTFIARNQKSRDFAQRAGLCVPTGTSRALLRHPPFPFYTERGDGVYTFDLDGNRRIDFHGNYTAIIHGHGHPAIVDAIAPKLRHGTSFASPAPQEFALASLLCDRIGSVEKVVFNNSGSEAVMVALRVARAITGRNRIGKFEGAYHGSSDFVMVGGHGLPSVDDPALLSTPHPDVGGLPRAATEDVVLMRYNSPEAVREAVRKYGRELAAIIVEPMLGAGGIVPANSEFLRVIREETAREGIVLVCDEVITLRQASGGAQSLYGLEPDITTMAKIIGGGFPIGAVGGRRAFMKCFDDPTAGGTVANLGTFSANAVSVTAGSVAMQLLDVQAIAKLNALGDYARTELANVGARHQAPIQVSGSGSLFQIHWTQVPITDARAVETGNQDLKLLTFLGLANHGIHASMRGMCALSTPMEQRHIDEIVGAFDLILAELAAEGWIKRN